MLVVLQASAETPKEVNDQQALPKEVAVENPTQSQGAQPTTSTVEDLIISQVYSVGSAEKNAIEVDAATKQAESTATQEQATSQPADPQPEQDSEAIETRAIVIVEEEIADDTQHTDDRGAEEMDYSGMLQKLVCGNLWDFAL